MLIAGGCGGDILTVGGVFAFYVSDKADWTDWIRGSAYNLSIDISYVWRY